MEDNTKLFHLTFEKGITNNPSDMMCSDQCLEDAVGMLYRNGENRVIQSPQAVTGMSDTNETLYIHTVNEDKVYIKRRYDSTVWKLAWYTFEYGVEQQHDVWVRHDDLLTDIGYDCKITSMGTYLLIEKDGMHVWKWNGNSYESVTVSSVLPEPQFEAKMVRASSKRNRINFDTIEDGGMQYDDNGIWYFANQTTAKENWKNLMLGNYDSIQRESWQQNLFTRPFLLRYAIKLKSGGFTNISNPILMMPSYRSGTRLYIRYESSDDRGVVMSEDYTLFFKLQNLADFRNFSELIDSICVFVSEPIDLINRNADPENYKPIRYEQGGYAFGYDTVCATLVEEASVDSHVYDYPLDSNGWFSFAYPTMRSDGAIDKDICETSFFYKIFEIKLNDTNDLTQWTSSINYMREHVLDSLTSQTRLDKDDYFSRSPRTASVVKVYNSRLYEGDITRGFFGGFDFFISLHNQSSNHYIAFVKIKTDAGDIVVRHDYSSWYQQGIYFYYPDPRAIHVTIIRAGTNEFNNNRNSNWPVPLDRDLIEHPSLHGAYYFRGINSFSSGELNYDGSGVLRMEDIAPTEHLPNYFIASDPNNPVFMPAEGYAKVGNGKILAITAITQNTNSYQFGKAPLIVFATDGVWAASINNEGKVVTVDALSREVLNNVNSVIQTDNAVFFSSAKGLMCVDSFERSGRVSCVSEQLSGKTSNSFVKFLAEAYMAYDYRDSLLWIFKRGERNAYVMSLNDGTFSKYITVQNKYFYTPLNDYPDYILQIGSVGENNSSVDMCTLLNRPDINDDARQFSANLMSRPIKFDNGVVMKSLRQIKHIMQLHAPATNERNVTFFVWASNDLRNWHRLTSLHGKPWKYYKFEYVFENLKATDTFDGVAVMVQERRTNKLR